MKAAVFEMFQGPITVQNVVDPQASADTAVIELQACGVCRSDWHGWMGHDGDISLPHVPGHEISGIVAEVGSAVKKWKPGDRVTVPFCCGCGSCEQCRVSCEHICDSYTQPGFTHWGAFAERVLIRCADVNLVRLPDSIDFETASSLGCRFATSFRGIVDQGKVRAGETVAVFGCGGVGLSAVMIASAFDARVIAIDINDSKLATARSCGAETTINATQTDNLVEAVRSASGGGVQLSVDALGSRQTCFDSISVLRKRGRQVQIGLMLGDDTNPAIPMSQVIANELEVFGSHGMPPSGYARMLQMIAEEKLNPTRLITNRISLSEACDFLPKMNDFPNDGVTVINEF